MQQSISVFNEVYHVDGGGGGSLMVEEVKPCGRVPISPSKVCSITCLAN